MWVGEGLGLFKSKPQKGLTLMARTFPWVFCAEAQTRAHQSVAAPARHRLLNMLPLKPRFHHPPGRPGSMFSHERHEFLLLARLAIGPSLGFLT